MIKLRIASNGHFMLAGANRFLLASSNGIQTLATTLTLTDYQSSYAGGWSGSQAADPQPVVQRKAGTTLGDVPVLYTFTGNAPSMPQARVMKGSTVIKDWTTLDSISVEGNNGLGTLVGVPQGCDYTVEVRDGGQPANSATTSVGSKKWGVGVVIVYMGQSNMIGTLSGGGGYNAQVPGTQTNELEWWQQGNVKGTMFDVNGWHGPLGNYGYGTGSGVGSASGGIYALMRIVGNNLKAKHGIDVPVGMVSWAFNATGIENYYPGVGGLWNALFDRSGTVPDQIGFKSPKNYLAGDFEGLMWHQGEANGGDSSDSYRDKLATLYSGLVNYVAQFGRTPANLFFGPAMLGNYGVDGVANIESIRIAASKFEALAQSNNWPKARIGWNCIDLQRNDGDSLHFGDYTDGVPVTSTRNKSATRSMHRSIQTVLYHLGLATFSGRGPSINPTFSRNGLVVTLSVVHEGGNGLRLAVPGNPIKGFYANTAADFSGTDVLVTAALTNNNTQITVTFPNGTTFPCYLKYMGGRINSNVIDSEGYTASCNPNITNPVYDNVVYPTGTTGTDTEPNGLPLLPTFAALVVN